uniref:Uncharacterized protein n=1 Tax=Anguilla anguilla TaxID=7936 RepID=A0A0E9SZ19_ANGAN
MHSCLSSRF